MKKHLVAGFVLLTLSLPVLAGGKPKPPTGSNATSNAAAFAGAAALAGGGTGYGGDVGNISLNNTTEAADYGDLRIVPSAIAPNVTTNVICPMVAGGSKAASVFFLSGSGTHKPELVDICVAFHLGQMEVVEQLTCARSEQYRKANANCVQDK